MRLLEDWLSTPGRQAAAWAVLGVLGIILAASGLLVVLMGGSNSDPRPVSAGPSPTSTRPAAAPTGRPSATAAVSQTASSATTPSATATASPTSTALPTETPRPTATPSPLAGDDDDPSPPPPTATPTPSPTATSSPTPVSLAYCPGGGSSAGVQISGLVTIGGLPAPTGTSVTLLFGDIAGPSTTVVVEGAATGYTLRFSIENQDGCANRPGAALSLLVGGRLVATGQSLDVGSGFYLIPVDIP